MSDRTSWLRFKTPASYWDTRVQISARRPAIFFFLRYSILKFGHDRFLSNPFQFIIQYQPFIRRYAFLATEKSSLNKLQKILKLC
jgi:hypothetical protein